MTKEDSKQSQSSPSAGHAAEDDRSLLNSLLSSDHADGADSLFLDDPAHHLPFPEKEDFLEGEDLLSRLEDHGFGWLNSFEERPAPKSDPAPKVETKFSNYPHSQPKTETVTPYVEPVKAKPVIIDVAAVSVDPQVEASESEEDYHHEVVQKQETFEPRIYDQEQSVIYNKKETDYSATDRDYSSIKIHKDEDDDAFQYVETTKQPKPALYARSFQDQEEDAPVTQRNFDSRVDEDYDKPVYYRDDYRDDAQSERNNIIDDLNLPAEKPSLMSALLPYVAAIGFFTFIAGAAVFYFVATHEQEDRTAQTASQSDSGSGSQDFKDHSSLSSVQASASGSTSSSTSSQTDSGFSYPRSSDKPTVTASTNDQGSSGFIEQTTPVKTPQQQAFTTTTQDSTNGYDNGAAHQELTYVSPQKTYNSDNGRRQDTTSTTTTTTSTNSRPVTTASVGRTTSTIPLSQEADMLARGRETLRLGDVAGARLIFQYLADQGSANGAYAMGQTYDSSMLNSLGVRGLKGDVNMARKWYEKAAGMGNRDAAAKIGQ